MRVTTDTSDYCAALAAQVRSAQSQSADVLRLSSEGEAMCRQGMIIGGLHRLRRALAILRKRDDR